MSYCFYMRAFIIILYILVTISVCAHAQVNLVPNPSFEKYINCPVGIGQFICPLGNPTPSPRSVDNWISPIPNTPDYFNSCNGQVPNNYLGSHAAHTGNAYSGVVIYSATSAGQQVGYQEYIHVQLDSALRPGQRYLVSCYAQPAFPRDGSNKAMALQWINAGFSDSIVLQQYPPVLLLQEVPMQDSAKGFIADTTRWTFIYGYYTARGGERWLTLGNFYNKYPPVIEIYPLNGSPVSSVHGYYIIDDVSVTTAPPCDTVVYRHDTTLCSYPALPYIMSSSVANAGSYRWSNGGTTRNLATDAGGTFWCIAASDCHLVTDTFHVNYYKETKTAAVETVTCDTVHTFSGRPGAALYRWSTGDTTQTIIVNQYGNYTCTSLVNCTLYMDEYDVSPLENTHPQGITLGNDTTVCNDMPLTIGAHYGFARSYRWSTGDTSCCISPSATGTYTLTVRDKCYDYTDSVHLDVQNCNSCLFVPNAFSPNNDGINDNLGVRASCTLTGFSWHIYNRWGQLVFSTDDINVRWNGLYKADYAPVGSYYYHISYSTPSRQGVQMLRGDITLLR